MLVFCQIYPLSVQIICIDFCLDSFHENAKIASLTKSSFETDSLDRFGLVEQNSFEQNSFEQNSQCQLGRLSRIEEVNSSAKNVIYSKMKRKCMFLKSNPSFFNTDFIFVL
jgi:hypothetical protein